MPFSISWGGSFEGFEVTIVACARGYAAASTLESRRLLRRSPARREQRHRQAGQPAAGRHARVLPPASGGEARAQAEARVVLCLEELRRQADAVRRHLLEEVGLEPGQFSPPRAAWRAVPGSLLVRRLRAEDVLKRHDVDSMRSTSVMFVTRREPSTRRVICTSRSNALEICSRMAPPGGPRRRR